MRVFPESAALFFLGSSGQIRWKCYKVLGQLRWGKGVYCDSKAVVKTTSPKKDGPKGNFLPLAITKTILH